MKKSIFTIFLLIIILSCFAIPMVFAEENITQTSNNIQYDILSDMTYYMDIDNPIAIDKNDKYLAVANEKSLFIKDNNNQIIKLNNITPESFSIKEILIFDNKIALLTENTSTLTTQLIIVDILNNSKNTLQNEEFTKIANITKKDNKLVVVLPDYIIFFTITDDNNVTENSRNTLDLGIANLSLFKFINNEAFLYTNNSVRKVVQGEKYTLGETLKTFDYSTITDYYIINNSLYYISNNHLYLAQLNSDKEDTRLVFGSSSNLLQQLAFDSSTNTILVSSKNNNKLYILALDGTSKGPYENKGNSITRLDTPLDITTDGKYLYIADSENKRIIKQNILNANEITALSTGENKPTQVAFANNNVYYLANGVLYNQSTNKKVDSDINTNVTSIETYNDSILFIANNELFSYNGIKTQSICTLDIGYDEIKIADSTNFAYLINKSNGNIKKLNLENNTQVFEQHLAVKGTNYNIDFRGTLFVQNGNQITKFTQSNNEFLQDKSFIVGNLPNNIYTCIDNTNGEYYFVSKDTHLLYNINGSDLGIVGINNIDYKHPTDYNILQAGTVLQNTTALISPTIPESSRMIDKNEKFLVLAKVEEGGEAYYYVANNESSQKEYIKCSDMTLHDKIALNNIDMSAIVSNVEVFKYPYKLADKLTDNSGNAILLNPRIKVNAVERVAEVGVWDWYKIKLNTQNGELIGYVKCDNLAEITPTVPPQSIKFMKTKAQKIGEKICIYKEASLNSQVLFDNIKDGIDIQLVDDFNENATFTKVLYNDQIGYILTANLQNEGLTPNQIIAISITCTAVVAFTLILLLFLQKNKRNRKKVAKMNPEMLE